VTDFKAKMHQILFRLGCALDTAGGAFSAPPNPLAGFGGRFAASGRGWAGKRRKRGGRGEWRAPKLLFNHGPSLALVTIPPY